MEHDVAGQCEAIVIAETLGDDASRERAFRAMSAEMLGDPLFSFADADAHAQRARCAGMRWAQRASAGRNGRAIQRTYAPVPKLAGVADRVVTAITLPAAIEAEQEAHGRDAHAISSTAYPPRRAAQDDDADGTPTA